MTYSLLKLLHIASVVVFLGNILTGLFWAARANRTRDLAVVASTFEGIIRSDRIFTTPGVIGILVSGITAAMLAGFPILGTGWILWPSILFLISGAAFGMRVAPLQRRLAALARASDNSEQSWEQYEELYRKWEVWGLVAIGTPAIALAIMVLKPSIPAL
jgi:uncharacterized membrane protein